MRRTLTHFQILKRFCLAILVLAACLPVISVATATTIGPGQCVGLDTTTCPGSVQDITYGTDFLDVEASTGSESITGTGISGTTWTANFIEYAVLDTVTGTDDFWYFTAHPIC